MVSPTLARALTATVDLRRLPDEVEILLRHLDASGSRSWNS
jgi:hypothetical protein